LQSKESDLTNDNPKNCPLSTKSPLSKIVSLFLGPRCHSLCIMRIYCLKQIRPVSWRALTEGKYLP